MTLSSLIRRGGLSDIATVAVAHSQESLAASVNPRNVQLREQARQARDWDALYAILDEAQVAYDSGDVTCEEVQSLAGYAAGRSVEVPECAESESRTLNLDCWDHFPDPFRGVSSTLLWPDVVIRCDDHAAHLPRPETPDIRGPAAAVELHVQPVRMGGEDPLDQITLIASEYL